MTEFERWKYQHDKEDSLYASIVSKSWQDSDFDILDNWVMQKKEQARGREFNRQKILDKKSYDAFVENAAKDINDVLKSL